MVELVVRSQCNSSLRKAIDTTLDATFPVWGVIAPLFTVGLLIAAIGAGQSVGQTKMIEYAAYSAVCF